MTAPRGIVRSRRRARSAGDLPPRDIQAAMHAAGKDQDAWDALRPDAVRYLTAKVGDAQLAARIFAVYRRRPELMPRLPPGRRQSIEDD